MYFFISIINPTLNTKSVVLKSLWYYDTHIWYLSKKTRFMHSLH